MMDKKKILIVAGLLGLVLVGMLVFGFLGARHAPVGDESVTQTISDGIAQEMADSKSDAYRGRVSTEEYFERLGALEDEEEEVSLVSEAGDGQSGSTMMGGSDGAGAGFGGDGSVARVFGEPDSPAPVVPTRGAGASVETVSGMSSEERLDYDRRRAEMVRYVLAGSADEEMPGQAGHDGVGVGHDGESAGRVGKEELRAIELGAVDASGGIVSSLDDEPSEGVSYGVRPFRCMFVRDQKLSSGQRVTLRLLEEMVVDGVRVPANTHLAAICQIGERLELSVRSLEMGGRIVALALDAYDIDGLPGIYCPETAGARSSRRASEDALQLGTRTFGGLVGDFASSLLRTGASLVRSASGEVSVKVVSGYEFYLVKAERR